jgi:hypothetical protein
MINIRNKHVIIVAPGYTLKKYWRKIDKFINFSDSVIIGCNMMDFVIPDIYFWSSERRYKKYGYLACKDSEAVFQWDINEKIIKKYWKGSYVYFYSNNSKWRYGSDNKKSHEYKKCCIREKKKVLLKEKKKVLYGCFGDCASKALFWTYMHGAKKITLIGVDGYTFYSKEYLKLGKASQNCYSRGLSGGFTYKFNRKMDWDRYKTLRLLYEYGKKKYGVGFEIITPTIHEEFYNDSILNIEVDINQQKWIEPTKKEYKQLYFDSKKNRRL